MQRGDERREGRGRASLATRLIVGVGIALTTWAILPSVPREQGVVLSLGPCARDVRELTLTWTALATGHSGGVTLHHPAGAPSRLSRRLRAIDGEYELVVSVRWRTRSFMGTRAERGSQRTEATRRVRLEGSTVTLRLEELCP